MSNQKPQAKESWIERVGNKMPDPITIFCIMTLVLLVLSKILSAMGISVVHPVTGDAVAIKDLLTPKFIGTWLSEATNYYKNFAAMPMILAGAIGMSLADKTGLLTNAVDAITRRFSKTMMIAGILVLGILGNYTGDIIYLILPPIAAACFMAKGMNPLLGIFVGYAGCGLGFSSNFVITMTDLLVSGFSQPAAATIDPDYVLSPAMSYFYLLISSFVIIAVGTLVTKFVVAPKLGEYDLAMAEPSIRNNAGKIGKELTPEERKGLRYALISVIVIILIIVFFTVGPINVFKDENGSIFTNGAPLMAGTIMIAAILCFVPGLVYGIVTKQIKNDKDATKMMVESMKDMCSFIVFAFFISQFVNLFNASNLGTVIAISTADLFNAIGFKGIPLFLATIIFFSIMNLFVGSISSKWAFMAYIFVPMYMLLGYSPELVSVLYRIGDSATNIISPLYTFAPLVLMTLKRYKTDAGYGTMTRYMAPYALWLSLALIAEFIIFWLLKAPLGPGSPYFFTLR